MRVRQSPRTRREWLRLTFSLPDMNNFDIDACSAQIERDGYALIPELLNARSLTQVRADLAPFLGHYAGRNNFEGYRTERVYTLAARAKVFEQLTEDARVIALCDHFLQPGYLLTASQAIQIAPGESPQPIHYDDTFYPIPRPRPAISLSLIVAVDAFTPTNGATEIIPGSHRWSDAQIAGIYDGLNPDAPMPNALARQLVPMAMPAGTALVFLGTLLHRGGANRSQAPRLALTSQYCQPWARTQENFYLGVPRERVQAMSPRLQALLGYNIHPPFMGHVTASHPLRTLGEDYVNAVRAQRGNDAGEP